MRDCSQNDRSPPGIDKYKTVSQNIKEINKKKVERSVRSMIAGGAVQNETKDEPVGKVREGVLFIPERIIKKKRNREKKWKLNKKEYEKNKYKKDQA